MNPEYPIYVISKGRADSRLTVKALTVLHVPHRVVIEAQERDAYAAVIDPASLLILPFSNLGQGSIPARNWVWDHAISEGHKRHWILDDNIAGFYRWCRNQRIKVADGTIFRVAEAFTDRYSNIRMAGFQYLSFGVVTLTRPSLPPFLLNTRVYSCILIDNDTPHRWRGRYNEDTDLSLRILKDGDCTVLFYAFLADKQATMTMKGGNTEDLYQLHSGEDGRLLMARSLCQQHPDVTKVYHRWGRWQHHVDYRRFKTNRLIRRPDLVIATGVNDYGMKLVKVGG